MKPIAEKKPKAWAKIQKHPDMIKRHKSVALLQLQYNYACNMRCDHCAITNLRQPGKPSLTLADVHLIADQADAMGLASICISGGEPLIFPDLEDVIDAIGPERFVLSMDTNGWLLDEERVKWLVHKGVDRVHLSIDGMRENHDKFRHKEGSWLRCVYALAHAQKHGLGVIINICATRSITRSGELERHLEYVSQFGFHTSIIHAKPVGSFCDSEDVCQTQDIQYIQGLTKQYNCSTHLSPLQGIDFGCLCFKRHFSITAYGDVLPCPWIPITYGNIHESRLEDIVNFGLGSKWFSYDRHHSCLSGNCDSEFYKRIFPQLEGKAQPVSYLDIEW